MARYRPSQQLTIPKPCNAKWEDMHGDSLTRHCGICDRNVLNGSAMTPSQIEAIITTSGSHPCMRIVQHEDGSMLTAAEASAPKSSRVQKLLTTSLLSVISLSSAFAQQSSRPSLEGVVVDASGAPVPAAAVKLLANQSSVAESKTDATGHFLVDAPGGGAYLLAIIANGFVSRSESVTLHDGKQALPTHLVLSIPAAIGEIVVLPEKKHKRKRSSAAPA